ncbi:hypothetical protein M9194_18705 [Vibrio sp. S4M6]|uniref:hypothetical protein n=1 Tax=Vibrio sinus TaxID=2946865 RepID=UPI00202A5E5E|nr:hypothetical protein [Vibrio sinus]MCL9783461.1 hypothetical protein [Vibrio sinus]
MSKVNKLPLISIIVIIFFIVSWFAIGHWQKPPSLSHMKEKVVNKHYTHYLFNFTTHSTFCYASVNGVPIIDSMMEGGSVSGGYDITPLLEKGGNNIEIQYSGIDTKNLLKLNQGDYCSLKVFKIVNNKSISVASIKGGEVNGRASAKQSLNYNGGDNLGKIDEGITQDPNLYGVKRTFVISHIPAWEWSKATKLQDTKASQTLVMKAYRNIYQVLKDRDINELKKYYQISLAENALNDGSTILEEWYSLGIKDRIGQGFKPEDNFGDHYELKYYGNGKMFRLVNKYGNSPIVLRGPGGHRFSYTPYFSYIDGKVVIVR